MTNLEPINGSKIKETFAVHIFFGNKSRIERTGLVLFFLDPAFFFSDKFIDRLFVGAHGRVDDETPVAFDDQRDRFAPGADELIDRDHNIVQIHKLRR